MSKIICVLGAGRSGTSLIANLLAESGFPVSNNLVKASAQNPKGAFEDLDIIEYHRDCMKDYGADSYTPMPLNWRASDLNRRHIPQLRKILTKKIGTYGEGWVVKDPNMPRFLHIWESVSNSLKIVPVYILASRDPKAIITSLTTNYNISQQKAEAFWLMKHTDIVLNTKGYFYQVHYEDLLTDPRGEIQKLLEYCGKQETEDKLDMSVKVVERALNRSSRLECVIQNPMIEPLYEELKAYKENPDNADRLLERFQEANKIMNTFATWSEEKIFSRRQMEEAVEKTAELVRENEGLRQDIRYLSNAIFLAEKNFSMTIGKSPKLIRKNKVPSSNTPLISRLKSVIKKVILSFYDNDINKLKKSRLYKHFQGVRTK